MRCGTQIEQQSWAEQSHALKPAFGPDSKWKVIIAGPVMRVVMAQQQIERLETPLDEAQQIQPDDRSNEDPKAKPSDNA